MFGSVKRALPIAIRNISGHSGGTKTFQNLYDALKATLQRKTVIFSGVLTGRGSTVLTLIRKAMGLWINLQLTKAPAITTRSNRPLYLCKTAPRQPPMTAGSLSQGSGKGSRIDLLAPSGNGSKEVFGNRGIPFLLTIGGFRIPFLLTIG